jgi:hypothetical protein
MRTIIAENNMPKGLGDPLMHPAYRHIDQGIPERFSPRVLSRIWTEIKLR